MDIRTTTWHAQMSAANLLTQLLSQQREFVRQSVSARLFLQGFVCSGEDVAQFLKSEALARAGQNQAKQPEFHTTANS
jgi:HEAT repeat protein